MKKTHALPLCLALLSVFAFSRIASADPLSISNVQKSFDALACTVTISWDTNKSTDTDIVKWDTVSCALNPTYPNVENANQGTHHSVTFSVDGTGPKVAFVIESTKGGQFASTPCAAALSGPCIAQ